MAIQDITTASIAESLADDYGEPTKSSNASAVEDEFGGDFEYLLPPTGVRFILFRAAVEAQTASSAMIFTTEEEARAAHSRLRASAGDGLEWTEVVRIGGGERPAVVVWSGRPFPPVAAQDALSQAYDSRQAGATTG